MAKIDNITLGTVRAMPKSFSRSIRSLYTGDGYTYPQDVNWVERGWNIRGTLNAPSAAVTNSIENLNNHSNPVILDLNDKYTGFISWVMVERFPITQQIGTIYRYDLNVKTIPCIGTTYMQTLGVYLHDLDYRASYKKFDPLVGRFNKQWSADRLEQTWEFYVDNDLNAITVALLEVYTCFDISSFRLRGWKAAAWDQIGEWGGADIWNLIVNWVDDDAVAHNIQVQKGVRGEVLPGVGTISNGMGNYNRVLCEIDNLTADATPTSDRSTHYGGDQLLLEAKIISTSREALRPYPVIDYITGGLGPAPA